MQGKIAVSTNASTHGILSVKPVVTIYESQDQWRAHRKAIMEALRPEGGMEQALADRVASCSWRLNRVLFFEAQTLTDQQENLEIGRASCRGRVENSVGAVSLKKKKKRR